MSHLHQRKENNCLNCNTVLYARYCHACGQENVEPQESVWHLVRHFLEDVTHFDGKFFKTLKQLLLKPGFLPEEYGKGRRASYLHPIRMYLLSSAIFFLVMFSFTKTGHYDQRVAQFRDSLEQHNDGHLIGQRNTTDKMTGKSIKALAFPKRYAVNGVHVYDSIQNTLAGPQKDNVLERYIDRRMAAVASVYHKDPNDFMEKATERFLHSVSKIFFISLPLFALLLQLLYIRRKNYYFAAHAVFSIYFYCAIFIMVLPLLFLNALPDNMPVYLQYIVLIIVFITVVWVYVYLYIAMRRYYKQGWFKTLIKLLLQIICFNVFMAVLTLGFYLNTIVSLAGA